MTEYKLTNDLRITLSNVIARAAHPTVPWIEIQQVLDRLNTLPVVEDINEDSRPEGCDDFPEE